jgi:hypothetical protein
MTKNLPDIKILLLHFDFTIHTYTDGTELGRGKEPVIIVFKRRLYEVTFRRDRVAGPALESIDSSNASRTELLSSSTLPLLTISQAGWKRGSQASSFAAILVGGRLYRYAMWASFDPCIEVGSCVMSSNSNS